ncbi:hypothetical protein B7463_g824, partial [Scytalidium lignicola]
MPGRTPSNQAFSLGIPLSGRFEISLQDLANSRMVDRFVQKILESCPPFNEHKDISTGSLIIDTSRLAYISKMKNGVCAWWASWEALLLADNLTSLLGGEKALNLCLSVERTHQSPESEAKAKRVRPRIRSLTDDIVVKKAHSGVKNKLVNRGIIVKEEEVILKKDHELGEVESNNLIDIEEF